MKRIFVVVLITTLASTLVLINSSPILANACGVECGDGSRCEISLPEVPVKCYCEVEMNEGDQAVCDRGVEPDL